MPRIYAKQSDIGKKFVAVVTDGGVPFEIPDNALISIWYDGASGSGNYTKIDKESAVFVSKNRISVELIQQMLSVPGDGTITIVINSEDGKQIGLWNIQYDVERVAGWGSEGAKDYFSAFSNAVENLAEASRLFLPDKTLTRTGRPAEAYETGLRISAVEGRLNEIANLPEGSTTGDAEIADARVGYDGKSYENVGAHIRDIGKLANNTSFAADNLVGNIAIDVSRSKASDGGLANHYLTEMELTGCAKYLDKIEVPVLIDRSGGYSQTHTSVVSVFNGRISKTDPIASGWFDISEGESSGIATLPVGAWFLPGDTIIVFVLDASTDGILCFPSVSDPINVDWLEDRIGKVLFPDGVGSEYEDVRFVGTATFYDTIKNDAKTYISYKKQTLTEPQQAQARKNIGAVGKGDEIVDETARAEIGLEHTATTNWYEEPDAWTGHAEGEVVLDQTFEAGVVITSIFADAVAQFSTAPVYIINANTLEVVEEFALTYGEPLQINKAYTVPVFVGGFNNVNYKITSDSTLGKLNAYKKLVGIEDGKAVIEVGTIKMMVYAVTVTVVTSSTGLKGDVRQIQEDIAAIEETLSKAIVYEETTNTPQYWVNNGEISGGTGGAGVVLDLVVPVGTRIDSVAHESANNTSATLYVINADTLEVLEQHTISKGIALQLGKSYPVPVLLGGFDGVKYKITRDPVWGKLNAYRKLESITDGKAVVDDSQNGINMAYAVTVTVTSVASTQKSVEAVSREVAALRKEIEANEGNRVLIVAQDGSGQFKTINEAVAFADRYMSREDEVTIIVYPGVYKEVIFAAGKRFVSLVGVNRETCIIRDDSGEYNNAPVRIQGNSYVANLTLIATHRDASDFIVEGVLQRNAAYAIHIDDAHADDDNDYVCTVFNCKLYSEQSAAAGIGLQKNQTVNIESCELIRNEPSDMDGVTIKDGVWGYKASSGALFFHAKYNGNYTDENGYQRIVMRNCVLKSNRENVVRGDAGGSEAQVEMLFAHNVGYSTVNGATASIAMTSATLSPLSYGNNMAALNYSE